jgi:hypothetical protein
MGELNQSDRTSVTILTIQAEEGFAVVQMLVPGKVEDGGEFPLQKALELLKGCDGCEFEKVGIICKSCSCCSYTWLVKT